MGCGHIELLQKEMFVDSGTIKNMETDQDRKGVPILRRLKEGRDGRLTVGRDWMEVLYCPNCGAKVDPVAPPQEK